MVTPNGVLPEADLIMSALPERKIAIVRTLVESAPDKVVGSLRQALSDASANSALYDVKQVVDTEVAERTLRNTILQPIAPMCVGAGDHPYRLTFPSRVLPLVWRGLRAIESEAIDRARDAVENLEPPHVVQDAYDKLTAAAAAGVRAREAEPFRAAADICDAAQDDGADVLATCLDLAPVVRRATERMPEWLAHPGSETTAAARLSYRDAVEIDGDAGAQFFEMLAAQLAQPWMIMRVISAVMEKPTERYLADSEMAGFGEHLLEDIEAEIHGIAKLDVEGGASAGRQAAKLVDLVVQQIMEIENSVNLDRSHGWGQRVVKQRASLAAVVEGQFRQAEKAAIEALPMHAPRNQRVRRQVPRLSAPPEDHLVGRATTLLSFADELRTTANYGGFSTARNKLVEKLGEYLDHYVEEVLDFVRTGDVENRDVAEAFLERAAAFDHLVRGAKAAELIRRRANAALHSEAAQP